MQYLVNPHMKIFILVPETRLETLKVGIVKFLLPQFTDTWLRYGRMRKKSGGYSIQSDYKETEYPQLCGAG